VGAIVTDVLIYLADYTYIWCKFTYEQLR